MPPSIITALKRKLGKAALVTFLFFGVFALGIYIGFNHRPEIDKVSGVMNKDNQVSAQADFAPFWKAWNVINEKHPGAKDVSDQEKVWGAISGLASSLNDPYTMFFPPGEAKQFENSVNGEFEGIGLEIEIKNKILTAIAPLKNSPAYKAGIKPGDKILKIDNTSTTDITVEKAINLIRGKEGTVVKLVILRDGENVSREIPVTREVINIPALDTELRPDGIFVIKLYQFSLNSADLFKQAVKEFINSKSSKLILDMRGNPGGYLDAAIDMASWFLPAGKTVVIEDFGKNIDQKIYRSKGYNDFGNNLKMMILVDNGSASASEILAGALKEQGVAKLLGEQTYGKGSVQELVQITPDSELKVTIAKWLTPKGISISEKGLTPDYAVPVTEQDIQNKNDPQMNKAVELLKQ